MGTDGKWERFSSVAFALSSRPGGEEKVEEEKVVKLERGLIFSSVSLFPWLLFFLTTSFLSTFFLCLLASLSSFSFFSLRSLAFSYKFVMVS